MTIAQALVLGVVQGLTEFLPVSSSGHLIIIPKLFGWADQGLVFDVAVHLGTLLAVVVYFRHRLVEAARSSLKWLLLLSMVPAIIVGVLLGDYLAAGERSAVVVAFNLIFWGIVLGLADWFGARMQRAGKTRETRSATWKDALLLGGAQAIALVPGTSRSGITMTAGMFAKFDKASAAEFSFLMSVPIIAAAGAKEALDVFQSGSVNVPITPLIIGMLAAAFSGFLAISFLMKVIRRYSLWPFVVYRVLTGALIAGIYFFS